MQRARIFSRFWAPSLYLLLAIYAVLLSVYKPYQNWDLIGYIAAAKAFEERDIALLHSFTYEQVRTSVSVQQYEYLTQPNGTGYRHTISTDVSAFQEQLPFYQIRPLYTGFIYLLYKTGIGIGFATHLISGIAVAVAIAFLYLMATSSLAKPFVYSLPFLAIVLGLSDLPRLSTPDGLAFLAVIVSAYLYLKRRSVALLILLPIMLGIRTDLMLFVLPLLILIFFFDRGNRWRAALSALLAGGIYVAINVYWSHPGWSTVFYSALVEPLTHPISIPPTLTLDEYFQAVLNGARRLVVNKSFVLFTLFAAYSVYLLKLRAMARPVVRILTSPAEGLAVVCIAFVGIHFLAFPVAWDRFFVAQYLVCSFSLLAMVTDLVRKSEATQEGAVPVGKFTSPSGDIAQFMRGIQTRLR